jgi:hypothetical protein
MEGEHSLAKQTSILLARILERPHSMPGSQSERVNFPGRSTDMWKIVGTVWEESKLAAKLLA